MSGLRLRGRCRLHEFNRLKVDTLLAREREQGRVMLLRNETVCAAGSARTLPRRDPRPMQAENFGNCVRAA